MDIKAKDKLTAEFAKQLTLLCVRNTGLENLHAGQFPISKTGDYSDVKVIDGEGNEIAWGDLSRLNNEEMKAFIKEVVNKIYSFMVLANDPAFQKAIAPWDNATHKWDAPELDKSLMRGVKHFRP